jgi:type IV pilus assembly protein PilE
MRSSRGFTLIEVMIVVVVIALLAAIGYPSYRDHIARGQRSQGQQFLSDIAQRQEQVLLDQRQYAATPAAVGVPVPEGLKYDTSGDYIAENAGPPPTFTACLAPATGSYLAARGDGRICINSAGRRWRESDGNGAFDATDCDWSNRSCKVSGES